MYKVQFVLAGFSWRERRRAARRMRVLLDALTAIDLDWLREFPKTPRLYESGVVYEREPPGREDWQDIPTTIERRGGDCEDLASWRTAELQANGVKARTVALPRPMLVGAGREVGTLWHIVVQHPNGAIEDPSRLLGMQPAQAAGEASLGLEAAAGWVDPSRVVVLGE
jgi:hypothetical protein